MKQLLLFFLLPLYTIAQDSSSVEKPKMKQYFFVMLKAGANRSQDSTAAAKIQEGHMANIRKLAADGKLIVAGPFGDDGNWRGIFILDTPTLQEAEQLVKTDPAIQSGRLSYEIHPWWTMQGTVFK
ncbi:MAG TPA: YciI family protein [Flavitalea sp.]|nr:YciI family protein [Flavitalea sp.]